MDIIILDKIVEEIESTLKVSASIVHTLWGVNTAIAEAVIEHAQNRKPDLVVLILFRCHYKARFYWPTCREINQQLSCACARHKSIGVHSPSFV